MITEKNIDNLGENNTSLEQKAPELREITIKDKHIILLGTAHVSQQSIDDVRYVAEKYDIDCIAVELDHMRYKRITSNDSSFEELDIFTILKQKKAMLLLSSIVLSSFQRRLGDVLEVKPGAEMMTAIEEAEKRGISCALIDRSVTITLKRAWGCSSFWGKQKILASLITMIFSKEKISEEQLQELKSMSLQGQVMEELSKFLPNLKQVLVSERDEYLAIKLLQSKGTHILAVLGAAHVPGVLEHLTQFNSDDDISHDKEEKLSKQLGKLEHIPTKKHTFTKYAIPLVIVGLIILGFFRGGASQGAQNILEWYAINGGLSLLGAIIAWAHPITMLVAFVAAPLTSINPLIGVGFVTGICEAFFRKPRVKDISSLQTMRLNIKMFYKNRVMRILLVFFLTTLFSALGTFIGIFFLL